MVLLGAGREEVFRGKLRETSCFKAMLKAEKCLQGVGSGGIDSSGDGLKAGKLLQGKLLSRKAFSS